MSSKDLQPLREQLEAMVGGKPVVFACYPYPGMHHDVLPVIGLGPSSVTLLTLSGPLVDRAPLVPLPDDVVVRYVPGKEGVYTNWRTAQKHVAYFENLFDEIDPRGEAVVLTSPASTWDDEGGVARLGGREVINARPTNDLWNSLEDKTSGALTELGLTTPKHVIADANPSAVLDAYWSVGASPVVISVDNNVGITTSGLGNFLCRREDEVIDLALKVAKTSHRVRVSEYVEGLPFGVQAFVDASGEVAMLGIAEQLSGLTKEGRFELLGISNGWRPERRSEERIIRETREAVSKIHESTGFVGALSIDGILGAKGPVYTEVNSRMTDGVSLSTESEPAIAWPLMQGLARKTSLAVPMSLLSAHVQDLRLRNPEARINTPNMFIARSRGDAEQTFFARRGSKLVEVNSAAAADGVSRLRQDLRTDPNIFREEVEIFSHRLKSLCSIQDLASQAINLRAAAINVRAVPMYTMPTDVTITKPFSR